MSFGQRVINLEGFKSIFTRLGNGFFRSKVIGPQVMVRQARVARSVIRVSCDSLLKVEETARLFGPGSVQIKAAFEIIVVGCWINRPSPREAGPLLLRQPNLDLVSNLPGHC